MLGFWGAGDAGVAFIAAPAKPQASRLRGGAASGVAPPEQKTAASLPSWAAPFSSFGIVAGAVAVATQQRRKTVTKRHAVAESAEQIRAAAAKIKRPEDLLDSPMFPMYAGATGGYISKSTRERHAITWTAKAEAQFEMPTGGIAIMNKGENLCYFRKKEQALSVGKQLRKMKIDNYKIFRLAKDGTVTFLHPADGVFPEKVNKGRVQVNGRPFTVYQNPQPSELQWTKYHMKSYEADPLTTMFVKARLRAWDDQENLFPLPQPEGFLEEENWPEYSKKMQEALQNKSL
jgi:photosystem I subunit 2